MTIFPNDDEFFEGNNSLKSLVKTLESYIEIDFDMESISQSVNALNLSKLKKVKSVKEDQSKQT